MPEAGYALYGSNAPQADVNSPRHEEGAANLWGWSSNDEDTTALRRVSESFRDTVLDLYAASKVFCIMLVTFEGMFAVLFSLITTSLYYFLGESSSGPSFSANISWTIVSFAVVSPMIMQIRQAFTRREQALYIIAEARSLLVNILLANALWNWGDDGRKKLPVDHVQKTKTLLEELLHGTKSLLMMPTLTRGRHRFTSHGRKQALQYINPVKHSQLRIVKTILPLGTIGYHWLLQARIEKLQNIKFYRTPQATRSFTRLFILVLPLFYGPYYVYIERGNEYQTTNFAFCLLLSVSTSLLMTGIFNVERTMEDPFSGGGMDGVHVHEVFLLAHQMLDECYNEKTRLTEYVSFS